MSATFWVLVQFLGTFLAPGPCGRAVSGRRKQTRVFMLEPGQRGHREAASSGSLQGVRLQLLRSMILVQESEGKEIPDTGNMSKAMGDGRAPNWVFTKQVACEKMRLEKQGASNAGLPMGPQNSQSGR